MFLLILIVELYVIILIKVVKQLLSENLKKLRIEKDVTQKELADYLGVTARTIGYYENGDRFPPPETINRIADYFNVSLDWLFGRTKIRMPIITVLEKANGTYKPGSSQLDTDLVSLNELQEFIDKKRKG